MAELIIYIIKNTVYLSVFYAFFMLVMRKTTFFRLNRIAFLTGTFICMVLPLVSIRIPGDMTAPMTLIENALNHTDSGSLSSERILLEARTSRLSNNYRKHI